VRTLRDRRADVGATEPGSLASTGDARVILGVFASDVARWLRDGTMPRPVDVTSAGPVWRRADLERFARERAERRESAQDER
jgi:predicted DNA-binding transcriptional regulator AlpA